MEAGGQDEKIDLVLHELTGMKSLLDREGIEFMVMIIPDEFQVRHRLKQQVMDEFGLDPAEYDIDLMQDILKEYLGAMGVPCIDLLPAFRRQRRNMVLYKPRDTHWSVDGNRLAARILYQELLPRIDASL